MDMGMNTVTPEGSRTLDVAKMLDIYTAPDLLSAVRSAMDDASDLQFDLGGSTIIHAAALQILIAAVRAAAATGRTVTFAGVSEEAAALWRLTGIEVALTCTSDSEKGAAA